MLPSHDVESQTAPPPAACLGRAALPEVPWGAAVLWCGLKVERKDVEFSLGQRVQTPYGLGQVLGIRPDVYVLRLDWGATLYRNKQECEAFDRQVLSMAHTELLAAKPRVSKYADRYLLLAAWEAILFVNWLLSKAWCALGIPSDCQTGSDFTSAPVMMGLIVMFLYGHVQVWFLGLDRASRFRGLFSLRRWWFFVLFLAASPSFSGLSMIPGFDFSFSQGSTNSLTPAAVAVLSALGVVCLLFLAWHVFFAFRHLPKPEFITYIVTRCCILLFYAMFILVGSLNSSTGVHLHHYIIAFCVSLFCLFDHWASLLILAVASGIMVQGLAVYDYQGLFTAKTQCVYFPSPSGGRALANAFQTYALAPFYTQYCIVTKAAYTQLQTPPNTTVNGMPW